MVDIYKHQICSPNGLFLKIRPLKKIDMKIFESRSSPILLLVIIPGELGLQINTKPSIDPSFKESCHFRLSQSGV
jgi:hypothetical protein